jgi:hypothetical protein
MSRPDFATLMGEHASVGSDERKIGDEWVWGFDCECGEFVPDMQCNQHLADAINHAIAAWLADEETREAAARAIHTRQEYTTCWDPNDVGSLSRMDTPMRDLGDHGRDFYRTLATAALAALTQREDTP